MSTMEVDEDLEINEDEDTFSNSAEGSSEDSDDDDDEDKISLLQRQIEASPYTYENHVKLISVCRKEKEYEELFAARERMSELFPMTPELWIDWINDERKVGSSKLDLRTRLNSLYERALKDYPSVSIWSEYGQFAIGTIGDSFPKCDLDRVREIFERAITSVGIHVVQGSLIWESFRELEVYWLIQLKNNETASKEIRDQEQRIFGLFKRQLSVPLLDMESTYTELKEFKFTEFQIDGSQDYGYYKALAKLKELKPFEDALYNSEYPHYEEYKKYIQHEKDKGEPIRVQSVFERALMENCLQDDLWMDYTKYMDYGVKIPDMSLIVHERAVRNCPWSVKLWVGYVKALERFEQPQEKITKSLETALGMGHTKAEDFKELWLTYFDYLRRKIDKEEIFKSNDTPIDFKDILDVFDRAITQMKHYFWGSESESVILKYYIFFMAKYKKDIESARKLWRELIDHGHKEEANMWLDFVNFERLYGDATHYRKLLLQAITRVSDWQETFVDLLITFERQEGTFESFERSLEKCEAQMKIVNAKRFKAIEEAEARFEKRKSSTKRQTKVSKNEQPSKSEESKSLVKMDSEGFKIPPVPEKSHHSPNSKQDTPMDSDSIGRKRLFEEEEEKQESKRRKVETSDSHGTTIAHDPLKDDRTVFISNLSYDSDDESIKDFFSKMGELEEVRLVRDYKGRSKGYCYVVYKSQESVKQALAKDRELLDGRPVLISPCEDRKNKNLSQSKFKFGTGLERKKLFVKGLPFTTTKEDLKTMFEEHGPLKDIRIVTYRNGHSKGLAYIEYEDETSAGNAVVKLDGTQIKDNVISVAISNPPPRKPKREFSNAPSSVSLSSSLGSGSGASKGPRGRGRTQLSLLPRSVMRPAATANASNGSIQNGKNSDAQEKQKPLSNSDFSKMLRK